MRKFIDSVNYLNQLICDSQPGEMAILESLGCDEYMQTLSTWLKIQDEKVEAMQGNSRHSPTKSGGGSKRFSST